MNTKKMKLKDIKLNPSNPRVIKDNKFKQLVKSIQEFPQMLEIRPIVVNDDNIVLGGNMRLRACQEAGLKEVPVIVASDLTPEQQKQFIIKDNIGYGEWDWELLANDWNVEELEEWGLTIPNFETNLDYSDKNKEVDTDSFSEDMVMTLKFTEEQYLIVREKLSAIAATPEEAILKLIENE